MWSINFLTKETGSGVSINEKLSQELNKPVIKKFKRVNARFNDNIGIAKFDDTKILIDTGGKLRNYITVIILI